MSRVSWRLDSVNCMALGEGAAPDQGLAEMIRNELGTIVEVNHVDYREAAEVLGRKFRSVKHSDVMWVLHELLEDQSDDVEVRHVVIDPGSYRVQGPSTLVHPPRTECWDRYFNRLESKGAPGLDELDRTTTEVVKLLAEPQAHDQKRKGLVMGNVQSGKTRHFSGVIARAMDAGYRFVIVLSGMNNNLREQTQSRLDGDLFIDPEAWVRLTGQDEDFTKKSNLPATLGRKSALWASAVVKKNITRLENLRSSLSKMPVEMRRRCPILIIDDEADQATPNTEAAKNRVSAINRKLREVWGLVEVGSYVAYTATPFANVLMDPDDDEDLFPSDFVYSLAPGDGYFGAERVFGLAGTDPDHPGLDEDGLDMVRTVTDADELKPPSKAEDRDFFDPELPPSLVDAVEWFIVASAVRRVRGQHDHSSMLVHTTYYTAPHFAMQRRLRALCEEMVTQVQDGLDKRFKESWDRESDRVIYPGGADTPAWGDVWAQIPGVLHDVEVIVDNGVSEDRLNYDDDRPRTVIAVGGGTLSRGLTLEGLVVSYFTRTSNTYDTLMQMGRWFGYRTGYEDLPRIWLAKGLDTDYAFLARVEKELREEIASISDSEHTPRDVGVRVRTHPGRLEITGAGKMANAKLVQIGMSGVLQQTFIVDGRPDTTAHNLRTVEKLLAGHHFQPIPWTEKRALQITHGVSTGAVARFLADFRYQEDQRTFTRPDLAGAVRQWLLGFAERNPWNVVLVGNVTDKDGSLSIAGTTVSRLGRSPLKGSTVAKLNFKVMTSPEDRVIDIDPARYGSSPVGSVDDQISVRRRFGDEQGLLILYPLGTHPETTSPSAARMSMPQGVGEDLLAFAIVFPYVTGDGNASDTFVSVRPTPEAVTDDESEDDLLGVEE